MTEVMIIAFSISKTHDNINYRMNYFEKNLGWPDNVYTKLELTQLDLPSAVPQDQDSM